MAVRDRRHALPRGTVTLLFTDVEGSTALLGRLGSAYGASLATHRRLLRRAFAHHGGSEVDTQGDAFLVAFRSAREALAAAVEAQGALAEAKWPARVRMGLHTGEPELREEGYVGLDVHRAARICAAAHGGQILLSGTCRDLVSRLETRDLGEHRLKDIEVPERLFQVGHDDFPPPRTLSARNLPLVPNRLVGRERELIAAHALLARPDVRLLTLTGAGGTGKSRLALELAAGAVGLYRHGAHLVPLAPVREPRRVAAAVAAALGLREPTRDAVVDHLRERELLLLLDNFEHVAPAAPFLSEVLAAAPGVTALVTSRMPLHLRGEHALPVPALGDDDAFALFLERMSAAGQDPSPESESTIREICRRLDRLPLAIELAAARTPLLPPELLLERLGLAVLSSGSLDLPERQRTLRATIDWSYRLLTPAQRRVHAALSVFRGGATLAGAEAVASSEDLLADLAALVDGGLLRRTGERLAMLDTVQEYARAQLTASGADAETRAAHARFYRGLAEEAERELEGAGQRIWLTHLDAELDDLRTAIECSLEADDPATALAIVSALGRFWRARGHVVEARRWLERGLTADAELPNVVRAKALWSAARQAMAQADLDAAATLHEHALELYRELGWPGEQAFCLAELGWVALEQGDLEHATTLSEEAVTLARAAEHERALSGALNTLAMIAAERHEHADARRLFAESLALRRRLGNPMLVTNTIYGLGLSALLEHDLADAERALGECLELARASGDAIHTAAALCSLGQLSLLAGDAELARRRLEESVELFTRLGNDRAVAECVHALGCAAAATGHAAEAARLWGAAEARRERGALLPVERTLTELLEPPVRLELGPAAFLAAQHEGAAILLASLYALP